MEEKISQRVIVVIGDEELFLAVLHHFPSPTYLTLFAKDLNEAQSISKIHKFRLLIIQMKEWSKLSPLLQFLHQMRKNETKVICVGIQEPLNAELAKLVDQHFSTTAKEVILQACSTILGERRSLPRAHLKVKVTVGTLGALTATVISTDSLFIPTDSPLRMGQMVQLAIESGNTTFRCWASVVRIGPGESGELGMVLKVSENRQDVRAHLSGLVHSALLLQYTDHLAKDSHGLTLPDAVTRQFDRQIQQEVENLRETLKAQMTFTEALSERLENLILTNTHEIKWKDIEPILARKMNAQREVIKTIVDRVKTLGKSQTLAQQLSESLKTKEELYSRLDEQEAIINTLRIRLDTLAETQAENHRLRQELMAYRELESKLTVQADLISALSVKIRDLSQHGVSTEQVESSRNLLEKQAKQFSELSPQIEQLRDQSRLGKDASRQLSELQARIEKEEAQLQQQVDALAPYGLEQAPPVLPSSPEVDMADTPPDGIAPDFLRPTSSSPTATYLVPQSNLQIDESSDSFPISERSSRQSNLQIDESSDSFPISGRSSRRRYWLIGIVSVLAVGVAGLYWAVRSDVILKKETAYLSPDAAPLRVTKHRLDGARYIEQGMLSSNEAEKTEEPTEARKVTGATVPGPMATPKLITEKQRQQKKRAFYIYRGIVLTRKNKFLAGRKFFTQALEINDDHYVRWLLAVNHERAGQQWAQAYHLEKAIEMSPPDLKPKRMDILGLIYLNLGKKEKACQMFHSALIIEPKFVAARAHQEHHCQGATVAAP